MKAYEDDQPSFTESFPYYISQLGPDVIPQLLTLLSEANAKDPTDELRWLKEDFTAALAQFTDHTEHRSEIIDHYLALYQSSGSITNHVELAGYLAATAIVTPRLGLRGVSQIAWSGHDTGTRAIPWLSQEDQDDFFAHVEKSYRTVFKAVNSLNYIIPTDLISWCRGFLLGMKGVQTSHSILKPLLSDFISAATRPVRKKLTPEETDQARQEISHRLQGYTARHLEIKAEAHARVDNPQPTGPVKRETPKINRNGPCPCGSGKKYKKCSL